jgi:hypothetical protein
MAEQAQKSHSLSEQGADGNTKSTEEMWRANILATMALHTQQIADIQKRASRNWRRVSGYACNVERFPDHERLSFKYFTALLQERAEHKAERAAHKDTRHALRAMKRQRDALQHLLDLMGDERDAMSLYDQSD